MSVSIGKSNIFKLIANDLDKAKIMAINRATNTTAARMKDAITDKYNIKRKDIVSKVNITKATKNRNESLIIIPHKPLGLIYFSARPTKKGVSYSIKKGIRLTRAHAFILEVGKDKQGNISKQVFERYGTKVNRITHLKSGGTGQSNRQRIRLVTGMSISQMFLGNRGRDMQVLLQKIFNDSMQKELAQASKYLIAKR